ncbi:MAG: TRAP transporter large permease [Lachnospiraceae bacterium]|nr:TRAP transporter large permease [Lachnospiraceae bacterium]
MAIAIFFIIYLVVMFLLGSPTIYAIGAAIFSIPLFFAGSVDFGLVNIAKDFVNISAATTSAALTIGLFMISGDIMSQGQITEKIFNVFAYFLGKKRGFMPIVCILTCMFFGSISGSSIGTTAAVGAMCYPLLVSLGYDRLFSAAIIVATGCLGMTIPPSSATTGVNALTGGLDLVVLYKVSAIVGVLCGILVILYCYLYCLRHGNGDQVKINRWVDDLRARGFLNVFKESIWALLTPVIILGSIFSGIAAAHQAAVLSIVYAVFVSVCIYKTIRFSDVFPIVRKSLKGGSRALVMVIFATTFSNALTALDVSSILSNFVANTQISSTLIMIVILIYMLIMGTMGAGASVNVVMPLAYPLIIAAGIEPFTASIAIVLMQCVGLITPPIGQCIFIMAAVAKCEATELTKPLLPYIVIETAVALFLVLFPGLFSGIVAGGYIPIP